MATSSRHRATAGFVLLCFLALNAAAPGGRLRTGAPHPRVDHGEMTQAAQAFVATLDEAARSQALFPFEDEERFNWHYIPRERKGLPIQAMTAEQRKAAHRLLLSALSTQGYLKATSIMALENILKVLENGGGPVRDPERYYFSIFGTPSDDAPWGWRVEGHHLSLNFSSISNELLAVTPAFMGANPGQVPSGPSTGLRILAAEEDLAYELMGTLDTDQRATAIIMADAPRDLITGADRKARLEKFEGLPAAEMTDAQRSLLIRLIRTYTDNMRYDVARERLAQIEQAGIERLYFAWAGSLQRGEGHYYRIHGPTVLFEYDNTQDHANHPHTVWRNFDDDWGEDLLREHYEHSGPEHGH